MCILFDVYTYIFYWGSQIWKILINVAVWFFLSAISFMHVHNFDQSKL